MARPLRDRFGIARFGDPALMILISLVNGPKHGHAIINDIEELTGIRLGPGTLYGALPKLEQRELIRALESDDRRQPYEITANGRLAVTENIARWNQIVCTTNTRLATP